MIGWLAGLFSSNGFMPHGYCFLWTPGVLWTDVISDSLIAAAYYSIPIAMWWFLRRRPDMPFARLAGLYALFIFACGTTHLFDAIVVWRPLYRIDALVRAVTAAASVATTFALFGMMPDLLSFPSRRDLETANERLREQIAERQRLEREMRELNRTLESRIRERTAELQRSNEELRRESLERSRAEERALALNRDLEQRVAERTQQLRLANRELEAFSYSVAHDLWAPLRAINGFAVALAEDCGAQLNEAGRRFIERICAASERMGALIDSLLELSRVSRGALAREPVDLSATAREVMRAIETERPRTGVTVQIEDGLRAEGDPQYLRIVLENLLGNAWKYTGRVDRPRIEVGMRRGNGGDAVWFVRDNGAGFDMRYADKLFGVFQRLHAPGEFDGNGIGLATVHRIVTRHGGRIWAESAPDEGATFYFTLGGAGCSGAAAQTATEE